MDIAWQYLDKRNAAIRALKDFESMKHIIAHTKEDIADARQRMARISAPILSDMPREPRNPQAGENRIADGLDTIDVLTARRHHAVEFMAWFRPAWDALSEAEQYVLEKFYLTAEEQQTDCVLDICERFHIERTSAYKRKDRALARLTLLLYGQ